MTRFYTVAVENNVIINSTDSIYEVMHVFASKS